MEINSMQQLKFLMDARKHRVVCNTKGTEYSLERWIIPNPAQNLSEPMNGTVASFNT
jgi:hypothetical protein